MTKGDIVRFKKYTVHPKDRNDCGVFNWYKGILVEYKTWEKIATILSDEKVHRVAARDVQLCIRYDGNETS